MYCKRHVRCLEPKSSRMFEMFKNVKFCRTTPEVQTHACARLHTHAHTNTRMRTSAHTRGHTHTHARARACTHARTRTHTHTHAHTRARARSRTHTHAHTHIYIHTRTHTEKALVHLRTLYIFLDGTLSSDNIAVFIASFQYQCNVISKQICAVL